MPTVSVYCSPCTCPDPYVSVNCFFASTAVVLFAGLKRVCPWQFGEHVGPGTNRSLLPVSNWTVNGRAGVPTVSVPCQSSPWLSSVSGTVPFGGEDDARRRRLLPVLPVVLPFLLPSFGPSESGRTDNGCASPVLVSYAAKPVSYLLQQDSLVRSLYQIKSTSILTRWYAPDLPGWH